METVDSPTPACCSSSSDSKPPPSPNPSSIPSPLPPSATRLWRPAAQRNLRNQWSKLASQRQQWASASSSGKSHANSLVNAYLSQRYSKNFILLCFLFSYFHWVFNFVFCCGSILLSFEGGTGV